MLEHIQEAFRERLLPWFGEASEEVLSWLIAAEDRRAVIVVGAGFSKNAVWKKPKSGSAADAIPLWSAIDKALSNDLDLQSPATYDGLMLPDLYTADLGVLRYHQALLSCLPDDEIEPGPVHRALFQLRRPEAVITTNQLDTLLDRGATDSDPQNRWFAIRTDADLAQPEAERCVQLIYLHGHRSVPDSWVFSHSEYEDLDRSRPVMMRRVRQLFSQHPVLFVGFSLTDTNFHALIRQTHRELKEARAPMLAIMTSPQPPGFVKHWQRYGVKIGTLRDQESIADGFIRLFELMGSVGRDRRPGEGVLRFDEALGALLGRPSLRERVQHFRVILGSRTKPGGGLQAEGEATELSALRDLWHRITLPTDPVEVDRIRLGPRFVRRAEVSSAAWEAYGPKRQQEIAEEEAYPFLGMLPPDRFSRREITARIVSYQLRLGTDLVEVAEWLLAWFDAFLDVGNEPDPSLHDDVGGFCDLLSWSVASSAPSFGHDVALGILDRCARILRRYQDERIEHLKSDFEALGCTLESRPPATHGVLQLLQVAGEHALNGRLVDAVSGYAAAVAEARQDGRVWYEWLALKGVTRAHDGVVGLARLKSPPVPPDEHESSLRADWKQRLDDLSEHPAIATWNRRLEDRKRGLMSSAVNKRRRAQREHLRMKRVIVMSGLARDAWTSWRDLDDGGASPWQAEPLVSWLIDADLFASDEPEEMRLRLRYGIKDTDEWLNDLAYSGTPIDLEGRRIRDRTLADSLLATTGQSVTENVAALDAIGGAGMIAQSDQVDSIAAFLEQSKRRLGPMGHSFRAVSSLSRRYAQGWVEYGRLSTTPTQVSRLEEYLCSIDDRFECDAVVGAVARFPWSRWATIIGKGEAMQLALRWTKAASAVSEVHCTSMIPCVAAERIYGSVPDASLTNGIREELMTAAKDAAVFDGIFGDYTRALGLRIAADLAPTKVLFDEVVALAYPGLSGTGQERTEQKVFGRAEALARILVSASGRTDSESLAREAFSDLTRVLLSDPSSFVSRVGLNPHLGLTWTILRSISEFCHRFEASLPSGIAMLSMQMLEAEPYAISSVAPILSPKYWGAHWNDLARLILRFSRPSSDPESQTRQSGIVTMLHEVLSHDDLASAAWLAPAWAMSLGNCTGEATLLANHQAALAGAVVCGSAFASDSVLWRVAADGVRAAARDPRPVIRVGVANVPRQLRQDGSGDVDGLKAEVASLFASETYAAVNVVAKMD